MQNVFQWFLFFTTNIKSCLNIAFLRDIVKILAQAVC